MLTPEELSLIPDSFDGLFQQLDEYIIKDYARRVAKAGKVTDTAEWMRARAEQIGLSEEEIQKDKDHGWAGEYPSGFLVCP